MNIHAREDTAIWYKYLLHIIWSVSIKWNSIAPAASIEHCSNNYLQLFSLLTRPLQFESLYNFVATYVHQSPTSIHATLALSFIMSPVKDSRSGPHHKKNHWGAWYLCAIHMFFFRFMGSLTLIKDRSSRNNLPHLDLTISFCCWPSPTGHQPRP